MELVRLNIHHTLFTRRGLAASLLGKHRHRVRLVQKPELALDVLGIGGVQEEATVEEGSVHVANHGPNVTEAVLLAALALAGADGVEVGPELLRPLRAVTLVGRIDLAAFGHLDVRVREHELAQRCVEREAVDAAASGDHEDGARGVHAVAGGDLLGTLLEGELLLVLGALVDAEDRAHADSGVDVGGAVKRVEHRDHVSTARAPDDDSGVLLLRSEERHAASLAKLVLEHVVGQDVQLLLLLALDVLARSSKAGHVLDTSLRNHIGDRTARRGDS
mmetsp:Transcript_45794/g.108609  ORF Transcript_45794/g.108609 Transcript_45794/m.108609 type:complete len:276 (+) Transcript_45794:355-1182(+)